MTSERAAYVLAGLLTAAGAGLVAGVLVAALFLLRVFL